MSLSDKQLKEKMQRDVSKIRIKFKEKDIKCSFEQILIKINLLNDLIFSIFAINL